MSKIMNTMKNKKLKDLDLINGYNYISMIITKRIYEFALSKMIVKIKILFI